LVYFLIPSVISAF